MGCKNKDGKYTLLNLIAIPRKRMRRIIFHSQQNSVISVRCFCFPEAEMRMGTLSAETGLFIMYGIIIRGDDEAETVVIHYIWRRKDMIIAEKYVEQFTKTIKKGDFKQYLDKECKLTEETRLEVYQAAIYQGYLDASRTFRFGNTLNKDDGRIEELARMLKSYIDSPNEAFDHDRYCNTLIGDGLMTYGQAQKIVNMAFKYLYCLVGFYASHNGIEKKFDDCHMPLDGIMLEWIYRNANEDSCVQKTKIGSWSKMNYSEEDIDSEGHYTYRFYVKMINSYCEKERKTPLEIDFENWQEMSFILAAEEFIKTFEGKTIVKNQGLEELLDQIKRIVNRE